MAVRMPLGRFPFLRTSHVDEAREAIGHVYCDADLSPTQRTDPFGLQLNVAPIGRVAAEQTGHLIAIDQRQLGTLANSIA